MRTIEERFWSKVDTSGGPDACWPWIYGLNTNGYGQFKIGRNPHVASRVAWMLANGDAGMLYVLHRCDNPPCCNPAHLFLGTAADNYDDMVAKGRHHAGIYADFKSFVEPHRRLTDEHIRMARHAHAGGESCRSIARRLGVSHTTISRLINGQHWNGYAA